MDIHEYNKTFYYGLSSLFFLAIISLLTYLLKFKDIQNFINLFILFIILLLAIYCSSIFKDNIIEDYINSNTGIKLYTDLSNAEWEEEGETNTTRLINIAVAVADEPFGRFNVSYFDSGEMTINNMNTCFSELYNVGYRGFHFYIEYPVGSTEPMCVFPYKDIEGLNAISTRSKKIPFDDVVSALVLNGEWAEPIFLCLTCLSPEQENSTSGIITILNDSNNSKHIYNSSSDSIDITLDDINLSGKKIYVTLGTYDNIPLSNSSFPRHYYIKENDLKYASFNVVTGFGLYAPLINYTKTQQDTFNARGYDEDIQQSVNLAYLNGVQFVCIPPTYNSGSTLGITAESIHDYPTTISTCLTQFTDNNGDVYTYRIRKKNILGAFNTMETQIQTKFEENSSKIKDLKIIVDNNSSRLDIADSSFANVNSLIDDEDFGNILNILDNQEIDIQTISDAFVTHRGQHKRLGDHLDDT